MNTYRDELYHDGQPGMHWGIRKYRNYDGTLTEAGRKRYGVGPPRERSDRKPSRAERKALKEVKRKASAKAAEKKARQAEADAKAAAEEAKKELEALKKAKDESRENATQEEVNQARLNNERRKHEIDAIKLEREYKSLKHPPKQKTPITTRLGNLIDLSRKVASFSKDIAEIRAAFTKGRGGESALDKLRREAETDKLNYDIESRNRERAKWRDDDAKSSGQKTDGGSSKGSAKQSVDPGSRGGSKQTRDSGFNAWPTFGRPALPSPRDIPVDDIIDYLNKRKR